MHAGPHALAGCLAPSSVCLSQLPRDDPCGLAGEGGRQGGREEAGVWEDSGSGKLFTVFRHHLQFLLHLQVRS